MHKPTSPSEPAASVMDVIDDLAGLTPDESALLRSHRPDAVSLAQESYHAIFPDSSVPDSVPSFGTGWRLFAAARAAELEGHKLAKHHYLDRLLAVDMELAAALAEEAPRTGVQRAVLQHVELLTRRPGESNPENLADLQMAGLAEAEIVMLSQVVSFIAFQLRLAHGLTALKETL